MEDAVSVHVFDGFEKLVNVKLYSIFGQVIGPPLDCFVQVHLHNFEHKSQPARRLVVEHLNKLNNVAVGRETLKGFDFSQVLDLHNMMRFG